MKKTFFGFLLMVLLGLNPLAQATLWDRGGGLVYDDVLNVTWLQDANYGATELTQARIDQIIASVGSVAGHTLMPDDFLIPGGSMTWWGAMAWADQLAYGGYDDWRLPTTVDGQFTWGYYGTTTAGYNITTSEMGYMSYVNLGNKGYYDTSGNKPQPGWSPLPNASFIDGNGKTVSFQNLQHYFYWSGTEFALNPSGAWGLYIGYGEQSWDVKDQDVYFAWAVRDGDSTPVPEPATMLLLASGLVGLVGFRKKLRRQ